jgi:uncharacterized membrane protein
VQLFHVHPAVVHFPVALLVAAPLVQAVGRARRHAGLEAASSWLLWAGVVTLWAAAASGLVAERTAPRVPPALEVLHEHRALGLWTTGLFTALAAGRIFLRQRWTVLQLLVGLGAAALLVSTAVHGGELVYGFGMGVVPE